MRENLMKYFVIFTLVVGFLLGFFAAVDTIDNNYPDYSNDFYNGMQEGFSKCTMMFSHIRADNFTVNINTTLLLEYYEMNKDLIT